MGNQMVFERYEQKYLLTPRQKRAVQQAMAPYMRLDKYGRTVIRNIYFDTENYRLIRRSLERPVYKEKLRLRSYQEAAMDAQVFLELKKKYRSVVYKRRMEIGQGKALDCLTRGQPLPVQSQIGAEINYFCQYYGSLEPTVFLSYEREAYYSLSGGDFRVTLDENIRSRQERFSFESGIYGTPLLPPGMTLLEVKTSGALPMWLVRCLTAERIYKTSFSKYGEAYQQTIQQGVKLHA